MLRNLPDRFNKAIRIPTLMDPSLSCARVRHLNSPSRYLYRVRLAIKWRLGAVCKGLRRETAVVRLKTVLPFRVPKEKAQT